MSAQIRFVTRDYREDVLQWASDITGTPADPVAVHANALPLLAWLEAGDGTDREARWKALRQHWRNVTCRRSEDARLPMDDPDGFVNGARVLYGFLADPGGAR